MVLGFPGQLDPAARDLRTLGPPPVEGQRGVGRGLDSNAPNFFLEISGKKRPDVKSGQEGAAKRN